MPVAFILSSPFQIDLVAMQAAIKKLEETVAAQEKRIKALEDK